MTKYKPNRGVQLTDLVNDWAKLKELIRVSLKERDFEKSFHLLEGAGYLGYKYNFIYSYTDQEIENSIQELVNSMPLNENENITFLENRVVFYDFFALENRGFTQQYLDVFIKCGVEILYIVPHKSLIKRDNMIIKTLLSYKKVKFLALPDVSQNTEKLNFLMSHIVDFRASKVFVHNAPWDILSCCMSALLNKFKIETYLINITDHTYWPGVSCFTNIIDFREYGYRLNFEVKGIPKKRLLLIPTPAYISDENTVPFLGFPKEAKNMVVGFGGGSYYKIVDSQNTYLNLIKKVLTENLNFIFLFANVGGDKQLNEFIKCNGLIGRMILIGDRKDINEIFARIDIFFNTYPYGGGLMLHYAVNNRKPILSLWKLELYHARIDKVLDIPYNQDYIIKDEIAFTVLAKKLINHPEERNRFASLLIGHNANQEFTTNITKLLKSISLKEIDFNTEFLINQEITAKFHIDNDNLFLKEYPSLKKRYFNNSKSIIRILKSKKLKVYFWIKAKSKIIVLFIVNSCLRFGLRKLIDIIVSLYNDQKIEVVRTQFKKIGTNSIIPLQNRFLNPHLISIGDNFSSLHNLRLEAIDYYAGESFCPEIIIGNNVMANSDIHIGAINQVIIGNDVLLASRIYISDHSHGVGNSEELSMSPISRTLSSKGPVIIEDNVWIGEGVCILSGVRIGKNSIIGANSVVNKNIPPNSVAAGIPAKIVRSIT